jgi:MFS family permease
MNQIGPNPPRHTNLRWLIVVMLLVLAVLAHFNRVSISVVGNERLIKEGLVSEQRMGQVYTAFLLVYTVCMLPAGWFIDRVGPTNALTCMAAGMGACVTMTGFVGWLDISSSGLWLSLLMVRGMAGAASSPLHPGAARSVYLWVPPRSRSWANGLVTSGALLGIAGSYPVFGWLMDKIDWPAAFVVCGAGMILFAIVWRSVAANHATSHPWSNYAEQPPAAQHGLPGPAHDRPIRAKLLQMMRDRGLVLLSLSYAAVGYFQYLFFYWIEYYFDSELKLPTATSRRASSMVMLAMAVGMAGGGWMADWLCHRWGIRWGRRTIAACGMLASSAFALLGISAEEPERVVLWFALALAALGLCEGVFWTTVTELGGRAGGVAAAFLNTLGNGGGAVAPWLTAVLMQRFGWHVAIGFACTVCGLGGMLWFGFDPARSRPD